jgi:glycosyltransferase involved in cell wall biosynthesis
LKRVLFIAHHRLNRSPGQRYRFEQYFNWFEENGIQCELSNLLDEEDDKNLYRPRNYWNKLKIAVKSWKKRRADLKRLHEFDLVVIYREARITRGISFEKKVAKQGVPMLFDFDDAIWVKDMSEGNKWLSFLKSSNKIQQILPLCSHVTAGNEYLAEFAKKYNQNVSIVPSTIDCEKYVPLGKSSDKITIGWVGSHTTVKHFELVINVYKKLLEEYKDRIQFKVIGDPLYKNPDLGIVGEPWSNEKEVELFNSIDIGVMPLEEDAWTKGKCGMKGLLYMSVGKPAVMSAVGMNCDIIEHEKNGYVPVGEEEWFKVLSELIENNELREKIGETGRKTVLEKYSFDVVKHQMLDIYSRLLAIQVPAKSIVPYSEKKTTKAVAADTRTKSRKKEKELVFQG